MNIRDLEVGSWVNSHVSNVTDTIESRNNDKITLKTTSFPMKNISPTNSPGLNKTRELPKLPDKNYKKV